MAQVMYYHAGRGLLRLSCVTAQTIDAGMRQAMQLVVAEAMSHQHGGIRWHLGAYTTFTCCARCGQTAIVTWCDDWLFVDSCLQMCCQPVAR